MTRAIAVLVFSTIVGGCAFNQKFYHPDRDDDPILWAASEEGFLEWEHGKRVHWAFAEPQGPRKATVFVLRGDGGNLASSEVFVRPFVQHGYAVFIFDYPGFGKSDGRPTHRSVLLAADAALAHMLARPDVRRGKVLVAGFSLGGQLAIVLTAMRQGEVDALLVEATFTSHEDIAAHASRMSLMARMAIYVPYSAKESIASITIPKLVIHSRQDRVIPYAMGVELYQRAHAPKSMWTIDGEHMQGFELHEAEYVAHVDALLGFTTRSPTQP